MSLENPDILVGLEPDAAIPATPDQALLVAAAGPKEPPRKRYAAPSAPRVLRCMLPSVNG